MENLSKCSIGQCCQCKDDFLSEILEKIIEIGECENSPVKLKSELAGKLSCLFVEKRFPCEVAATQESFALKERIEEKECEIEVFKPKKDKDESLLKENEKDKERDKKEEECEDFLFLLLENQYFSISGALKKEMNDAAIEKQFMDFIFGLALHMCDQDRQEAARMLELPDILKGHFAHWQGNVIDFPDDIVDVLDEVLSMYSYEKIRDQMLRELANQKPT